MALYAWTPDTFPYQHPETGRVSMGMCGVRTKVQVGCRVTKGWSGAGKFDATSAHSYNRCASRRYYLLFEAMMEPQGLLEVSHPVRRKAMAIRPGAAGVCVATDGACVPLRPPSLAMGSLKGLGRRCVDH
jgi:hypothetical protein